MTIRAALAFAAIAACGGCGRLDASGLGATDELIDAARSETIAADAAAETELPDTAELVDSSVIVEADIDAPAPLFCDATDPDLIGCYRFENTEHAVQPWDDSMYAHHGTSTGVTFAAGQEGRAIVLDAMSYDNVPDKPTLGVTTGITLEAWIRAKSLPTTNRVGIVDANGRYGLFILPGGVLRATAPSALDTAGVITTAKWLHVAYTWNGAKQVIYVSGLVVKENPLASGVFGASDGAGLAIGMNSPSGDNFDGMIDSLRIYRVARTPTQICRAAGTC
jgi:hypothetical protein